MRLTHVPEPGVASKRLAILRTLRTYTGMDLASAKMLCVAAQEGLNPVFVPRRPAMSTEECFEELVAQGCRVQRACDCGTPSREQVAEVNEEALFADGLDDALIGYVNRFGQPPLALYDRERCIDIFMAEDECGCETACEGVCEHAYERAVEHFDFNVIGAWMGDNTPAFATILHKDVE